MGVSVLVNGLLIWYVKKLLVNYGEFMDRHTEMDEVIGKYLEHVHKVYELEIYYGDATLQGLLDHTKDVAEDLATLRGGGLVELLREEDIDG